MPSRLELPSYLDMEAALRERFARIRKRPVVLEIAGLEKRYETRGGDHLALSGVDLQVHHREFVCVIGRSGCGKSTLVRIVAGLEDATGGEVRVDGRAVQGPGPDRGMVFQTYTLFPWLTVRKNVMFGLKMQGQSDEAADSEATRWIDLVGLRGFEDRYPDQLSGGMRQRVAIARALANRPRMLLMDEPFGALDAQTRVQMQSYLLQVWRKVDITVMFITHDLDEAIFLADRIVVLGRNPGHVQEIIEVPVSRPRSLDQLLDPAFLATRRRLEELIHPGDDVEERIVVPVGGGDAVEDVVDL